MLLSGMVQLLGGGVYLMFLGIYVYVLWVWILMPKVWNEVIMMRFMLISIMNLELFVLLRLCLNEVFLYVEHVSVWEMMNEGVSMSRTQS